MKKLICLLLALLLVSPICSFGSVDAAPDSEIPKGYISSNWTTLGAKFSGSTNNIIIDKTTNKVRDDGFEFTVNEDGGIDVHVPDYNTFAGACPTVVLASTHATPLDELEVKVTLAEETAFKVDRKGFYGSFSMLWSEEQITAIYDPETQIGEDSSAYAITNGMRNIGTPEKKGIYIIVGCGDPLNDGTKIASYVNIYLFDGEFRDAIDDVPGYRWSFTARNKPEVGGAGQNVDDSGIIRGHEHIDLSDGLTYYLRPDTTLGYVTVINGTEYYRGKGEMPFVGYFPRNVKFSNDDRRDLTPIYLQSMEYAKADIDLSFLTTVEEGYVRVMAVGNLISSKKDPNCYLDFTLDSINDVPAAYFDGTVHDFGEWETYIAPTCTNVGKYSRTCRDCGWTIYKTAPAFGHDWNVQKVTDATCSEDGSIALVCSRCGETETETIPAPGHDWSEWMVEQEATCTEDGSEFRNCGRCGEKEETVLSALGHSFTNYLSDNNATCTEDGTLTAKCDRCEATSTVMDDFSALGHSFSNYQSDCNATCTEDGTKTAKCDRCEATDTIIDEGSALGHDYRAAVTAPTCTEQGYTTHTCSRCGDSYVGGYVEAKGHDYKESVIEPTCTAQGYTSYICSRCGDSYSDTYVEALGHTWGEWKTERKPSYDEEGMSVRFCSACGAREEEQIEKLVLPNNDFDDVKDGKWYTKGVLYCVQMGFMSGMGDGVFSPNDTLTRAMFVTILAKIDGADLSAYAKDTNGLPFTDVKASYYIKALKWAFEMGYTSGTSDTTFGPNDPVTREQLAVFLYSYSQKKGYDVSELADISGYTDAGKISKWARTGVQWAIAAGMISGTSDTTLSPKDTATRAQVATIIMNYDLKVKVD